MKQKYNETTKIVGPHAFHWWYTIMIDFQIFIAAEGKVLIILAVVV